MPIQKNKGDEVFAGTVNITGSMSIQVTKLSVDTFFQKIVNLVQMARSEKSPSQLFIERFEGTYVKVVLAVVALMMSPPFFIKLVLAGNFLSGDGPFGCRFTVCTGSLHYASNSFCYFKWCQEWDIT